MPIPGAGLSCLNLSCGYLLTSFRIIVVKECFGRAVFNNTMDQTLLFEFGGLSFFQLSRSIHDHIFSIKFLHDDVIDVWRLQCATPKVVRLQNIQARLDLPALRDLEVTVLDFWLVLRISLRFIDVGMDKGARGRNQDFGRICA